MDELQQLFRDSAIDQIEVLRQLAGPVAAGDPASVTRARRIAHSLKGSGASYGFPEVSEAAAAVEKLDDDRLEAALARLSAVLAGVTSSSARKLILVVDDDPLITRLLENRLTTPGRRVTSMNSLQAARQSLQQSRPDLVLLDLFLPDGDGRTLLAEIRHGEETADIPVIVVSGAGGAEIDDEVIGLGADDFIRKPFLADDVVSTVSRALRSAEPASTGRAGLTASYRTLLEREVPISVVAVVPETHGPGGRRAVGPDPEVAEEVHAVLLERLGPDADIAPWAPGDLAIVSAQDVAPLTETIEHARLRLRTLRHPTIEGAVVSISAGVVCDDGRGLIDAHHRAHRLALDANREGGDRVVRVNHDRRSGRVLLAEDDMLTAALIIHRLEREGFAVMHQPDGRAALESARTEDFAIVILDVELPGMNGFDVLERLRSRRSLDETPIVMLTAAGGEHEVVRGFDLGANDYIIKPFSPAELTARLTRLLRT